MRYVLAAVVEARQAGWGEGGDSSESGEDEEKQAAHAATVPVAEHMHMLDEASPAVCHAEPEGWERACVEVVGLLDDCALPHALAQALWAQRPCPCFSVSSSSSSSSCCSCGGKVSKMLAGVDPLLASLHLSSLSLAFYHLSCRTPVGAACTCLLSKTGRAGKR
jgi:hypothetical protein